MKKKNNALKNVGCCLGALICSPLLLLVLIGTLIFTPFDYFKFKRSAYCKKEGAKYVWLVTTSQTYKVYKIIDECGLDISLYKKPDTTSAYAYFLCGTSLLIHDTDNGVFYSKEKDSWRIFADGREQALTVFLAEYKDEFTNTHSIKADNCIILMSENDEIDPEEKQRAENSGYFLFYKKKMLKEALIKFEKMAK